MIPSSDRTSLLAALGYATVYTYGFYADGGSFSILLLSLLLLLLDLDLEMKRSMEDMKKLDDLLALLLVLLGLQQRR